MIEFLITIVGLIVSLVGLIYTIWGSKKTSKKVSIGIERIGCVSLFPRDIRRMNIEIKYSGESCSNNLILFKGIIVNNGNTDIDQSDIFKPIQIIAKKDYKWLEVFVNSKPDGATVQILKLNDNVLELKWDLLKKEEIIFFEALFEVPYGNEIQNISDDFYQSLEFKFRITDLGKIERLTKIDSLDNIRKRSNRRTLYMAFWTLLMGAYLASSSFFSKNIGLTTSHSSIEFCIVNKDYDTIQSPLSAINKDKIEFQLKGVVIEQTVDEFNQDNQIQKINRIITSKDVFYSIMGGIFIFIGIIFIVLYFLKRKFYNNVV